MNRGGLNMFTNKKYDKLFELMEENNLDALMIAPSSDMAYLIDYHAHADERLNVSVVMKDRSYFHISPLLNLEEAMKKYPEGSKFYPWADGDGFLNTVLESFKEHDLLNKIVGVNETVRGIDVIDFQELMPVKFVNAHPILETYRIIKNDLEIANMKKAGAIADEVMVKIKSFIRPGLLESDVIEAIIKLYKEAGVEPSFNPIVATGKNSSMPHYNSGTSVIEVGDNVVVDCGCVYKNVCSDTSRTFFVGEPSEEQKKIYDICKRATFAAQSSAQTGMTAGSIDHLAREIIDGEGYKDCFLNRTGHGIGFSVHEAPYIKANNPLVLEDGMAFSLEPGIYIAGKFGMRVENIVIMEGGKAVSVNNSPVEIEEVTIQI